MKGIQIIYRLYYGLRNHWRRLTRSNIVFPHYKQPADIQIHFPVFCDQSYWGENTFTFLNQTQSFTSEVDWNYMGFGKLWNYNLLYFDYLNQQELSTQKKIRLIDDFLDRFESIRFACDPYPISLRCVNWIKFLQINNISDLRIERAIYRQYYLLMDSIEYHLMGNHLLENGCSLFIGGLYFNDDKIWQKGRRILRNQLNEQILEDGAHFERSPMYHQLLLFRLMDCYNVFTNQQKKDESIRLLLKAAIENMLGWIDKVTFNDGSIPHVNDATESIAPTTAQLIEYAGKLGLQISDIILGESGYRLIQNTSYEWFIDVGDIGPDYIPGHAHSDTLSFELHVKNRPIIVDTGISTYEECKQRIVERSTTSHNTVSVNGMEQTEVWKSFRVGRRARIIKLVERPNYIKAAHNGYDFMGISHQRTFEWNATELVIKDLVKGDKETNSVAYLHFHPQVTIKEKNERVIADGITICLAGHNNLSLKPYRYAKGFNQLEKANMIKINFDNRLETCIKL